jgi:hypothetical protein
VVHHEHVSRWQDRNRSLSRWLDRLSLWKFTLLWWAVMEAAGLLGLATGALWFRSPTRLSPLVMGLVIFPVFATTLLVWQREARRGKARG